MTMYSSPSKMGLMINESKKDEAFVLFTECSEAMGVKPVALANSWLGWAEGSFSL